MMTNPWTLLDPNTLRDPRDQTSESSLVMNSVEAVLSSDSSDSVDSSDSSDSSDVSQINTNTVVYTPHGIFVYYDVPVRCGVLTKEEQVWPSVARMRVLKNMR
jgi:hypothetical protein